MNFLVALETKRMQDDLRDGLRAAIILHYQEYTDQDELYGPFAAALGVIIDHVEGGYRIDLEELVSETEMEINRNGGIRSTTDGKRHFVQTYSAAYEEVASR